MKDKDDQKIIYQSSPNDILTTIINENTKTAIAYEQTLNSELSKKFDIAVKLSIFIPLISIILYITFYFRSCLLLTLLILFV